MKIASIVLFVLLVAALVSHYQDWELGDSKIFERRINTEVSDVCRDKDKAVASARDFDSADLAESGNSRITVISESGLYRIFAKCNLPKCELVRGQ